MRKSDSTCNDEIFFVFICSWLRDLRNHAHLRYHEETRCLLLLAEISFTALLLPSGASKRSKKFAWLVPPPMFLS